MRPIKFRGRDFNGRLVYGLLTKKKIRSSGEVRYAIATGDCTAANTIPVNEDSIAQLLGCDSAGNEVYEGDVLISQLGHEAVAEVSLYPPFKLFTLKEAQHETND